MKILIFTFWKLVKVNICGLKFKVKFFKIYVNSFQPFNLPHYRTLRIFMLWWSFGIHIVFLSLPNVVACNKCYSTVFCLFCVYWLLHLALVSWRYFYCPVIFICHCIRNVGYGAVRLALSPASVVFISYSLELSNSAKHKIYLDIEMFCVIPVFVAYITWVMYRIYSQPLYILKSGTQACLLLN